VEAEIFEKIWGIFGILDQKSFRRKSKTRTFQGPGARNSNSEGTLISEAIHGVLHSACAREHIKRGKLASAYNVV